MLHRDGQYVRNWSSVQCTEARKETCIQNESLRHIIPYLFNPHLHHFVFKYFLETVPIQRKTIHIFA